MIAALPPTTPGEQKKIQDAVQKATGGKNPATMTADERAQIAPKVQAAVTETMRAGSPGARPGTAPVPGPSGAPGGPQGMRFAGGPGGPGGPPAFMSSARYSEKDLANAKLPPPPEEDTQFDVLLRPGLLADVEIIVEKIPNAINVPMQAVFEREGKPVVYVKNGGVFEPRVIKPFKRSESVMVIAQGLKQGEIVALADPTAKKTDDKKDKKGDGGAMGALPGGGK